MSNMLRVMEILAESETSWEDAATDAILKAAKIVSGIKSLYITNFEAQVEGHRIIRYRINGKISYLQDTP